MKDQNRIWRLVTRKLAGEISEEELLELNKALKDDPGLGFYVQIMTDMWKQSARPDREDSKETEERLNRLKHRIAQENTSKPVIQTGKDELLPGWKKPSKKSLVIYPFNKNGMLSSYLKIAWRNLFRNKAFSFVNITGLAIGMASAILMILWILDELSYDQFHSKKDRIYQLYNRATFDGEIQSWGSTPMVMAPVLKTDYPEIEEVTRVNWVAAFILKTADKQLQTEGYLTDPGFLTMFDFPLLKGDPQTALNGVHSIVVTEKLARKLFVDGDAMGKVIRIDSNALFTVTGIMKDPPGNTQFNFEYLVPWSYMKEVGWYNENWAVNEIVRTYILLKPGVSEQAANDRLRNIIKSHASDVNNEIFVHPMSKWRLWSEFENGKISGGEIETVRLFGIIAGFILLIACINYMNLSTARSVKRAKEVGIRKVVGAQKTSLVGQFMWESILFSFLAGILALLLVEPNFGWFNKLTGKELYIPYASPYFWVNALGFIFFTGIIAGSYPAFYLSGYRPISVLKGSFKAVNALVTPRKVLVVLQFTFAIIFIICTIIIYRQIAYGKERDPGFVMDNLAYVYNKGDIEKNYSLIRNELVGSGTVTDITRTGSPIVHIWSTEDAYEWQGKDNNLRSVFIKLYADNDFVKTFGFKMIAGRDINISRYPTDSTAMLLTESAAKLMRFDDPVGQSVKNSEGNWHVVGVIKDFLPGIPYAPVYPITIQGPATRGWFGTVTMKLNPAHSTSDNLAKVASVFKKYNPDYPFEPYFVDKSYSEIFLGQERQAKLAAIFAGLTIFISCLGLFALATCMAENRIKEIGIRKVLGASVTTITTLLSKDFLKLVIISFVIASPLAWWAMRSWLQDYSYRVSISWWVFAVTALLSMLIAVITVSYQSIKAALANPVKSLRSE